MKTPKGWLQPGSQESAARARQGRDDRAAPRIALRRHAVAELLGQGLSLNQISQRLGASYAIIHADAKALLAALADDDAALMARRDLAERVALLALTQLEDLNAQVNARFELPEQDPPTIPAE